VRSTGRGLCDRRRCDEREDRARGLRSSIPGWSSPRGGRALGSLTRAHRALVLIIFAMAAFSASPASAADTSGPELVLTADAGVEEAALRKHLVVELAE